MAERRQRYIFHLLVPSTNGHDDYSWVKSKPSLELHLCLSWGCKGQRFGTICFSRLISNALEEKASIWDYSSDKGGMHIRWWLNPARWQQRAFFTSYKVFFGCGFTLLILLFLLWTYLIEVLFKFSSLSTWLNLVYLHFFLSYLKLLCLPTLCLTSCLFLFFAIK